MRELNLNKQELISGGDFVDGLCAGIALGSAVYFVGAATQFWNPVGWVSWTFVAVDVACAARVLS